MLTDRMIEAVERSGEICLQTAVWLTTIYLSIKYQKIQSVDYFNT